MDANSNSLNWFEVPTVDLARAKTFYERILGISLDNIEQMGPLQMSCFPGTPGSGKANGALVKSDMHTPSAGGGCVIYLNANPDLQPVVDRIPAAGGKVLMPKTLITPEIGYMAFFLDSEGNQMALHSQG